MNNDKQLKIQSVPDNDCCYSTIQTIIIVP
jgi:hypothetical protein